VSALFRESVHVTLRLVGDAAFADGFPGPAVRGLLHSAVSFAERVGHVAPGTSAALRTHAAFVEVHRSETGTIQFSVHTVTRAQVFLTERVSEALRLLVGHRAGSARVLDVAVVPFVTPIDTGPAHRACQKMGRRDAARPLEIRTRSPFIVGQGRTPPKMGDNPRLPGPESLLSTLARRLSTLGLAGLVAPPKSGDSKGVVVVQNAQFTNVLRASARLGKSHKIEGVEGCWRIDADAVLGEALEYYTPLLSLGGRTAFGFGWLEVDLSP
jgi:hypothetical protein